jgi:hypothetical protein
MVTARLSKSTTGISLHRNTKQHRQITQKQQSNRSQDIKSKHNAHLQLLLDSADEADLVIDNMLTCDRYIPAFA